MTIYRLRCPWVVNQRVHTGTAIDYSTVLGMLSPTLSASYLSIFIRPLLWICVSIAMYFDTHVRLTPHRYDQMKFPKHTVSTY